MRAIFYPQLKANLDHKPRRSGLVAKNSVVQCGRETCPLPRGCYFLQESKGNKCCDVCKGCFYKGRLYASSEEWTDPHDPCRRFFCQSGVITESRIYCHVNCKNPRNPPEGHCCPYCEDNYLRLEKYLDRGQIPIIESAQYPQRAEVTPGPAVSPRSSQQPRYLDLDTPLLSLELTAAAIPELTDARGAVVVAMARRPTPPRRHFSIHHDQVAHAAGYRATGVGVIGLNLLGEAAASIRASSQRSYGTCRPISERWYVWHKGLSSKS
ncbi:hypothetical protein HPB51_017394 [Rhipicephalus microplus]|uniref:VWFC domain-containing protein n=1 Tax=Rhipicephalus microplus TaxID=6941 RepID=A0A9J6DAR7_RHIMP|nr:hypothetical protein HPB51_017394 [Rhipicephalus microplus]